MQRAFSKKILKDGCIVGASVEGGVVDGAEVGNTCFSLLRSSSTSCRASCLFLTNTVFPLWTVIIGWHIFALLSNISKLKSSYILSILKCVTYAISSLLSLNLVSTNKTFRNCLFPLFKMILRQFFFYLINS